MRRTCVLEDLRDDSEEQAVALTLCASIPNIFRIAMTLNYPIPEQVWVLHTNHLSL